MSIISVLPGSGNAKTDPIIAFQNEPPASEKGGGEGGVGIRISCYLLNHR